MKIMVKESTIGRPDQETPKKRLWSSNLDQLMARIHLLTAYFCKPTGSSNFFDARVLKEALPFYSVAGRLRKDENGRIEVDCNAEGVLFVEADGSCAVEDFGDFTPSIEMLQLIPKIDYSTDISSYPLLILQIPKSTVDTPYEDFGSLKAACLYG